MIRYLCLMLCLTFFFTSSAQQVNAVRQGNIKGVVIDSASNKEIPSVTIAIYSNSTKDLLKYTLTNTKGEFEVVGLPLATKLELVGSFVGYATLKRQITLRVAGHDSVLHKYRMSLRADTLDEITIRSNPPVRMNGDTLEFNADAFKLDENAQTEDLLKILPGVTIWGDGSITVNGREVQSILVNGKPFFGTDARIATRNLPKNIVGKVQIYQKFTTKENSIRDSIMEVNIKLKEGKDQGYFGKIGAGYGTRKTFDVEGSLNHFSKKSQLSLAGTSNNINRVLENMSVLLANNTFKGLGGSFNQQADFNLPGKNDFSGGGLTFQYDLPTGQGSDVNRSTSEYFITDKLQDIQSKTYLLKNVNDNSSFLQENNTSSYSTDITHRLFSQYEKKTDYINLAIQATYQHGAFNVVTEGQDAMRNSNFDVLSNSLLQNDLRGVSNNLAIQFSLSGLQAKSQKRLLFSNYNLTYSLNKSSLQQSRNYKLRYQNLIDSGQDQSLNRLYDQNLSRVKHTIGFSLPALVSPRTTTGFFSKLNVGAGLDLVSEQTAENNTVADSVSGVSLFINNNYLTNIRTEHVFDLRPSLRVYKKIDKSVPNRYSQSLTILFSVAPQLYLLNSVSENPVQQLDKRFIASVSSLVVNLERSRPMRYYSTFRAQLSASSQYPVLLQLAPLVDSADVNYITRGNRSLKQQNTKLISLIYLRNSSVEKNPLTYTLNLVAGVIDDYITNANEINQQGRTLASYTNIDGYRYGTFSAMIRKSAVLGAGQLQFEVNPSFNISRVPIQTNNVHQLYLNQSFSAMPSITYSTRDNSTFQLANNISMSSYRLLGGSSTGRNVINRLSLNVSRPVNQKLSVSSNLSYVSNRFGETKSTSFTIWNAYLNYRMLKDKSLEAKVSALDLLGQSKGVTSFANFNQLTQTENNVLRQFFMFSVAWFPRKFGK